MAPAPRAPSNASLYGAFFGCILIWGSTFLFIAIGNDTVPPAWGATLRLIVAAAILFSVMAIRGLAFPRGDALRTSIVFGLCQFGLNMPLLYLGEVHVPSGLAAVVFATIPLTTIFFARLFGLERLSRRRILGGLVALAGIVVMFSTQLRAAVRPLALLEILAATWVACLGGIALKRGPRLSPIVANGVGCVVGAVACLIWTVALGEPMRLPRTWPAIAPILYLAVAGSVGAFVLWTWLVNHWELSRVSYMAVILPLVAVSLGALVRHERLGLATLLGAVIVLVGVGVGIRPAAPAAQPSAASSSSKASTG
jgi:drug/metabolite transporter (DMT)-like permease